MSRHDDAAAPSSPSGDAGRTINLAGLDDRSAASRQPCRTRMNSRTNDRQIVLAVDLDGTCADYVPHMRKIAAEFTGRPIAALPSEVSYPLTEWGIRTPKEYEQLHRFGLLRHALFRDMPAIKGASRTLRGFSNEGCRIRIVTSRLCADRHHAETVIQSVNWLDNHKIPYDDICFVKKKTDVAADIYIDDSPEQIAQLRESGRYVLCFASFANRDVAGPRCRDWNEVRRWVNAWRSADRRRSQAAS